MTIKTSTLFDLSRKSHVGTSTKEIIEYVLVLLLILPKICYNYKIRRLQKSSHLMPTKANKETTMRYCTVNGCERKHKSRGLCHRHYDYNKNHGGFGKDSIIIKRTMTERFWSHVDLSDINSCWDWVGAKINGYGVFIVDNKLCRSHRVVYEMMIGHLDDNLVIDHLCENRLCVNPFHLEQVTSGENVRRAINNRNGGEFLCRNGHDYSGDNLCYSTVYKNGRQQKYCGECNRNNVSRWRENQRHNRLTSTNACATIKS